MGKIIKLNESDLHKIAMKVINESEDKVSRYYQLYQEYKGIDYKLGEMINILHKSYGLGIDHEDEFLKYMSDKGHKMMPLLRKAKELSSKVVTEKYEELKQIVAATKENPI